MRHDDHEADRLERPRVRAAQNQSMFREVNERIEELAQRWTAPTRFICECLKTDCSETLAVTISDYEVVRQDPGSFIVALGHNVPDVEDIVGEGDGYVVVRKAGVGYDVAARLNPRRVDLASQS